MLRNKNKILKQAKNTHLIVGCPLRDLYVMTLHNLYKLYKQKVYKLGIPLLFNTVCQSNQSIKTTEENHTWITTQQAEKQSIKTREEKYTWVTTYTTSRTSSILTDFRPKITQPD